MAEILMETFANPFSEERLTPEHLALLFPATFYQNDESLALHMTESCLVETTTWDGDIAIGETAFWLKVLSTPQTEYLKQQKRLFKSTIAQMCKNLSIKDGVANDWRAEANLKLTSLPTVLAITNETISPNPAKNQKIKANKPKTVIKHNPNPTTILELNDRKEGVVVKQKASEQVAQMTLDAIASPTPGFGLNSYKCKICDFATDTRERLNHHQKLSHTLERPYSCEYCDYTSRYPWNIKTHVDNVHLKTKRFKCADCEFTSPQACLLRRHVSRIHTNARDVKCEYCDYCTNHKDVLRRHVHMKHTGDFDHKCPYCAFGRDAKYEVEDHINAVHLKKVIYQCSECNFQTYRKITLRNHHKDHETKELISCPGCSTKSIYPSAMAKHIREDHPELPIPAELKDARRKIEQKHIIGGDVDYTPVLMCRCKMCDFTCERITKLRAHVRRVHNQGSRHSCIICKTGFANKRNLKNHMNKQHPGVEVPENQPATSQGGGTTPGDVSQMVGVSRMVEGNSGMTDNISGGVGEVNSNSTVHEATATVDKSTTVVVTLQTAQTGNIAGADPSSGTIIFLAETEPVSGETS